MDEIKSWVTQENASLIALRRDLHQHPELGRQENRTAELVETKLKEFGLTGIRRVTGTGVTGLIEGGPGPVLMIRADLDALPVTEDNNLPYKSTIPGVMHACGHDAHTAIAISAARILSLHRDRLAGSVKMVFEPNEEEVGALAMIEEGILEGPKVDAALGLHIWAPLPLGQIALGKGTSWAGMDHFLITIRGRSGHTATPHTAADPIMAAAQIIQGVQVMQTRQQDPFLSTALVFGRISAGTAANIIPDHAELEGTLRYFYDGSDDGPYKPRLLFKKLVEDLAKAYQTEAEVDFYCSQPALINDPAMSELGRAAIRETLPGTEPADFLNMGGEDFSEFSARVPAAFAMIGGGGQSSGAIYPHHHPKFTIDEASLGIGLEWLLRTTFKYFNRGSNE